MLFYKQLSQEDAQKLLNQISDYTEDILLKKGPKLSYQLAYDQVYQLCRNQKQEQLLEVLDNSLRKVLPEVFNGLKLDSQGFLQGFAQMIEGTEKELEMISRVCLYLDLNYCKRELEVGLVRRLKEVFLGELFRREELVGCVGRNVAESHIRGEYEEIGRALGAIRVMDNEEEYFTGHFVKDYLPVIAKEYGRESQQKFKEWSGSDQIEGYIKYARGKLQKQGQFLSRFWAQGKKCAPNKAFIIKQVYQIVVSRFKEQIYTSHKSKLFSELTLEVLQLFKYGRTADIQKHADWYNLQIKERLETFSHENNTQFITDICTFYSKIMSLLQTTHNKFDIHYRSRFAFEEWINAEQLQMPLRLNDFITNYCTGILQQDQKAILERIRIVFVLMKEKNLFQKHYRRKLIDRLLNNFAHYPIQKQTQIIALMEKECSQEFVKNLTPIIHSYNNTCKTPKTTSETSTSQLQASTPQLQALLLNVENWPYQQKNTSAVIHQDLLKLARQQTDSFAQTSKDKSLYWHPIVGVVRLQINFLNSQWKGQLIVNTCMANLLLHFTKTNYQPYEIKSFCCQTAYKLDDIYDSVKKLLTLQLLTNLGTEQNYRLTINQSFTHSSNLLDVLSLEPENKFEAKPLEELKADRKFMVEAIIVKIMKRLKHTNKETILKQASPLIEKRGFNFNAKFVQSAVDRLIDKEFIRDHEDGTYGYIA